MRSHFIVLDAPVFDLFIGVVQIEEPMPAQAFDPHRGIEASMEALSGCLERCKGRGTGEMFRSNSIRSLLVEL